VKLAKNTAINSVIRERVVAERVLSLLFLG
jgi:hypothetical protein